MLYNDSTNSTGICQEIDSICGTNSTSYTLADKNRRLNSALDDYVLLAIKEASGWSVEDTGETDLPIASTDLVSGQADYSFPNESLVLETLQILLADGVTYRELSPVDQINPNAGSGIPTGYKKVGNSFILTPTPNYTVTSGIKNHYRRAFNYSTVSSTTFTPTSPGIPSVFHTWLARKASLPYLVEKGIASKNDINALILEGNDKIIAYFGRRPKDVVKRMSPARESNK
jgi:hypothetical protein